MTFEVNYLFRNNFYNSLSQKFFEHVIETMTGAFLKRCEDVYENKPLPPSDQAQTPPDTGQTI